MKKYFLLAAFLISLSNAIHAQDGFNYTRDFKSVLTQTKNPAGNLFYDKLLVRFKADDTTMTRSEILSLLIGFTDKPAYKPYNVLETERLVYDLNDKGKFQQAHDTALALLKDYPLSYQALKELSYAYEKLGRQDSSQYSLNLVAKIMSAMLYSGNGRTPETAMFALGPADGQHLLRGAGLGIGTMGSGADRDGNFLDMLQAVTNEGNKVQMYFNIQHASLKMFDGKSAEEFLKEAEEKEKVKKKKKGN